MSMTARFASTCPSCRGQIAEGAAIQKGASGKYEHATCPTAPPEHDRKAPRARRSPVTSRQQHPVGPELRNDRDPYAVGDVHVVQLTAAEVAECEARQGLQATDIPGDKPVKRAGDRRVAVVVIHADRIGQEWSDDNGYCGRYGAVVRLATEDEAAPILRDRIAKAEARAAAAAAEQAWQAELEQILLGRHYIEVVEPEERNGAVTLREERRGYNGTISARWSRLVDGSIMLEAFGGDDWRCGRYVTTEQLLELARASKRSLEDAILNQRYSALDRAIVWLAAQAGKSPRQPVTVTLCGLEHPVALVVRMVGPSRMVCAELAAGGSVAVPMASGGTRILYQWAWPIDRLREQLESAPSPEVFSGIEFAPEARLGGDRLPLPDGLWIEGMKGALIELEARAA